MVSLALPPALLILIIISIEKLKVTGQVVALGFCPKVSPMKDFDIIKYQGLWYEVEKYWFIVEAASSCVTVEYFGKMDNNQTFGVEISQIQIGKRVVNPGTTEFNSKDGSADLILDLQITQSPVPFTYRYPYYVLHTDYESYTIKYACRQVGPLYFQNMWILSRDKSFSKSKKDLVYGILRSFGLNSHKLRKSDLLTCRAGEDENALSFLLNIV